MTQYLFLFTIGPVQSFIAQARKTQDFYAGSFLLSHLIDRSMNELRSRAGSREFIFPQETIPHKPNRFIAKIESDDIEKLGKDLKNFVESKFENMASIILDKLNVNISSSFRNSFQKQIKTHLQVNWVALPLEESNYTDTYKELGSYLGAIKNVRNFQQLEETGRKCSLCGERNVLFYCSGKRAYTTNHAVSLDSQPAKYMSEGEGLCAVCFTKRFADKYFEEGYVRNYPSTAEIALMDSLNKLDSSLLDEYKKIFADNFDAELYYEDNLTKRYFEKNNYSLKKLEEAKVYLRKISEKAKENKVPLSKYYAILMLDGDSMGRWLSGEFLKDKTQLLDFHKSLTSKLGSFVRSVKDIIKDSKGKLVYAGGDDVLAFVNLNHLLPVMKELREKFPKFEEFGFKIRDNKKSSASMGIAIAHYKTPLSEVLKWARKMEKEAKSIDGQKDAFAIAVLKRSGETRKTVFKWQYSNSSIIGILQNLIKSLKQEEKQEDFSNTFIKNLDIEFRRLMDEKGKYENNLLIRTEMKRLIERSCMMTRKEDETKKEFLQRKKQAINDLTEKQDILYTNSKSLDNFLSSLDIADFIERGGS